MVATLILISGLQVGLDNEHECFVFLIEKCALEVMEILVFIVLCVVSIIFGSSTSYAYENYELGSKCDTSGAPGICKRVRDCPQAVDSIRKHQKYNFKRCFFDNMVEYICCPDSVEKRPTEIYQQRKYQQVGSKCDTSGAPGICKRVRDCPQAVDSIRKHQKYNFKRCFFDNMVEYICCPDSVEKRPTEIYQQRKYQQACDKIKKDGVDIKYITLGEDAMDKEFPHMVALGYEDSDLPPGELSWNCGATLISSNFLLTAAHCVFKEKPLRARLGVTNITDSHHQDIDIKRIRIHESYDQLGKHGDLAIIELRRNATFSDSVKPACLYWKHDDPRELLVTGWGKKSVFNEDDRSIILQKAKLVPVSVSSCNNTYSSIFLGIRTIENTQICAFGNASDACWGDSGGPLQIREDAAFSIVGIVSYGVGCGGKNPGVYTRVSQFVDWIEKYVWP
ncbi:serine protease persephone-like isoform X2 [Diabrotica undecimpunctata]|uniref:serine protease persephone-like isoform X2 n=1 Tax=Diabrotica undecimpunctata TaxID=50387 RepID=UPI003B63A03C